MRLDFVAFEFMQQVGSAAEAFVREAAIESGVLQRLAGLKRIREIEGIEPARDTNLAIRRLFDRDAPVTAPAEGSEPDPPVCLVGVAMSIANHGFKLCPVCPSRLSSTLVPSWMGS